ncbi:hypothetical protein FKP32DRAFT_1762574 [Trametes sanguinea]|nr:hypothetical protein FKP32DRAFT_1762574 [Trametes sanguinea]
MSESISVDSFFYYTVDDADFESIHYTGVWSHENNGFGSDTYKDTGSIGAPGSTASFNFSGLQVATFIALPSYLEGNKTVASLPLPNVTVALDDQPPVDVSIALNSSEAFWWAANLSQDATHTITIKVINQTDDFPFVFDEVQYLRTVEASATPTYTPPASQQTISAGSNASNPGFAPVRQTAASAAGSGLPVAAIVGGVVGGATLLMATALAFYFMCIRAKQFKLPESMVLDPYDYRRDLDEDKQTLLYHDTESTIATGEFSGLLSKPPVSTFTPASQAGEDTAQSHPPSRPASIRTISESAERPPSLASSDLTSPPNSGRLRKAAEAGILSVPRPTTYHADSGIRFVANNADSEAGPSGSHDSPSAETPTDVPPEYTPS